MHVWTHDRWRFPLPAGHRFPADKYALLRERVVADGHRARRTRSTSPSPVAVGGAARRVHDAALLARIRDGGLSVREERGLGLPWSPELVERGAARGRRHARRRATRSSAGSP